MRILGIDLGAKRVGIAVSDPDGVVAHPLKLLEPKSDADLINSIRALVAEYDVGRIVVGLPMLMKGEAGSAAREAQKFADRLRDELAIAVDLWDERLSTVRANRALKEANLSPAERRKRVDMVAAQMVLQSWLDAHRRDKAT